MTVGRKENQIGLKLGHDSREKRKSLAMIVGRKENQVGLKLGHDSREKRKSDSAQAWP